MALSRRTGIPLDDVPIASFGTEGGDCIGFAGPFSRGNALPAIVLGFTSATCLLLVYSLNTWLPALLGRAGFPPRAPSRSCSCSTAQPSSASSSARDSPTA